MISKCGIAAALLATLVACGGDDKPAQDPSTTAANKPVATTPPVTQPPPVEQPKPVETTPPPAPEPVKTEKPMSDNEILGYIKTANTGEIQMAEIAKKQATKKDAKDFAAMMITQHTDANNKEAALEKKVTTVKADDSHADTQKLKTDADGIVAKLKDAKGKDFDKVYMDSQVTAHRDVLSEIDNKLMPAAQNTEVKAYVTEIRKHVSEHLSKAEDIQKKMNAAASTTPAPASTTNKAKAPKTDENPAKMDATDLNKVESGGSGTRY